MDVQLKRGLIDVCTLAALSGGDSYGYQIFKDITPYIEISESTLYPVLKRLEAAGQITAYSEEFEGRLRKYYKITEQGIKRARDFLDEWKEMTSVYDFIDDKIKAEEKSHE